ncbi:MAG: 1-aminocyclopropane-1-carboxylate deaminase/D-cysteine desulfhydrase [Actinomycetota bacterium]
MNTPSFAQLPTPVEELPRLSDVLGARVLVKRDDLTGLAFGGNKARKLERLAADALARECDVLVTGGGTQSNHVRQTAAAARRLGLDCHAVLGGTPSNPPTGNVLLDVVLGATLELIDVGEYYAIEAAIVAAAGRLAADGRRPYAIPIGGASAPGVRAYVDAARELQAQRSDVDVVFVADGSGGTHAGLLAGFGPDGPKIVGVDVGTRPDLRDAITRLASDATGTDCGTSVVDHDHVGGGYGMLDEHTLAALRFAARTEGLLLDPVYTGKAFAALVDWVRLGRVDAGATILFWHTGGQPALFARRYAEQLGAQ